MEAIFSILYQTDKGVIHTGTGFLVYKNGLFITTGHTFRKKKCEGKDLFSNDFRALLFQNGKPLLFNIKTLEYCSFEVCQQKGPEYVDIAIGKLTNCCFDYLKLDKRRPAVKNELKAIAYVGPDKKYYGKDFLNLIDLNMIKLTSVEMNVLEADSMISDYDKFYKMERNRVPKSFFYNNCITLDGKFKSSASGCPILDNNNLVKGMLIGSPKEISITHALLAKYCSKSILFKSHYTYKSYEYLL